jgi:hypothetical protein
LPLIFSHPWLWINHPKTLGGNSRIALIFGVLLVQLAVIKVILAQAAAGNIDLQLVPLLVPYAFAPLVLSVLLGKNHGLFAAVFASLWGSLLVGRIDPIFLVISLITGFIAVYLTIQVRRRSRLIRAGVYVGIAMWVLAAAFGQIGPLVWENPAQTNWKMVGWQSLAAASQASAVLAAGFFLSWKTFRIDGYLWWKWRTSTIRYQALSLERLELSSLPCCGEPREAAEAVSANPTEPRQLFPDISKLVGRNLPKTYAWPQPAR